MQDTLNTFADSYITAYNTVMTCIICYITLHLIFTLQQIWISYVQKKVADRFILKAEQIATNLFPPKNETILTEVLSRPLVEIKSSHA